MGNLVNTIDCFLVYKLKSLFIFIFNIKFCLEKGHINKNLQKKTNFVMSYILTPIPEAMLETIMVNSTTLKGNVLQLHRA